MTKQMFWVTCRKCELPTFAKSDGVTRMGDVPAQLITCERCRRQDAYEPREIQRV